VVGVSNETQPWNAGKEWAELRASLKLSREKFAAQVGLTPGAVWRIEAKGVFKPGELEKLQAVLNTVTTIAESTPAAESPPPVITPPTVHVVEIDEPKLLPPQKSLLAMLKASGAYGHGGAVTVLPSEPEVLNAPELSPYQLFAQDGIRRYSNSEIQTFKRCRRKWYLAYYLGWHLKHQSPVGARAIGDRLHRALRWHYHPDPKLRVDVRDALEIIIQLDRAELHRRHAPDLPPLGLETKFSQEADLERVMVAGYVDWLAETGGDSEFIVTGAEEYVEAALPVPVNGQQVRIVGRLDARARRISDGVRLFIDHKSVGSFEGPARGLILLEQMKMYILLEQLAAQAAGNDERVDGAIFNMMRRCKRTDKAKPPFYKRIEVRHNPVAIKNFTTQLTGVIGQIEQVRAALDAGVDHRLVAFPTPNNDCVWSCDFMQVDSLMDDGSNWEGMLKAFYEQGDPSEYYVRPNELDAVQ
jgi:transcriptional regulator with XRE-family HTH domain